MYSEDLREKALRYGETHKERETAEIFGVRECDKKVAKLQKEQGNIKPKELKREGRKIKSAELKSDVEVHPDDFNWERAKGFGCTEEAMEGNKLTRKKRL